MEGLIQALRKNHLKWIHRLRPRRRCHNCHRRRRLLHKRSQSIPLNRQGEMDDDFLCLLLLLFQGRIYERVVQVVDY